MFKGPHYVQVKMLHWADRLLCSRGHDKGISYSWFKDFILQWVDRATSLRPPASNGLSVHPSRVTWTNLLMEMSIYGRKSRYTKKGSSANLPNTKTTGSDMGAPQQNKHGDLLLCKRNAKFQSVSTSKKPVHSRNACGKANYPMVRPTDLCLLWDLRQSNNF